MAVSGPISRRVAADAPVEELKKLTKLSPVYDIVSNPVPVSIAIITV